MEHLDALISLFERSFIENQFYLVVEGVEGALFEVFYARGPTTSSCDRLWTLAPARRELREQRDDREISYKLDALDARKVSAAGGASAAYADTTEKGPNYKITASGESLAETFTSLGLSLETLEREISSALLMQLAFLSGLRADLVSIIGQERVDESEQALVMFAESLADSVRAILGESAGVTQDNAPSATAQSPDSPNSPRDHTAALDSSNHRRGLRLVSSEN